MHPVWSYWITLLVASDVSWGNVSFPHSFYILSLVTAILIFFIVSRYIGFYNVDINRIWNNLTHDFFSSFGNPFKIKKIWFFLPRTTRWHITHWQSICSGFGILCWGDLSPLRNLSIRAELIFVTNITNHICGEKIVMWRNFGRFCHSSRAFMWRKIEPKKYICGEKMTNIRSASVGKISDAGHIVALSITHTKIWFMCV